MIFIKYTEKIDFEYDIQGIIRSFFPEEETVTYTNTDIRTNVAERESEARLILICTFNRKYMELKLWDNDKSQEYMVEKFHSAKGADGKYDRKETKNILKRKLYDIFSKYTGRELLWGTLSGIRPTKITSALLEKGMSKEEVKKYMKRNYYLSDIKAEESVNVSENELNILKNIDYKNGYSLYIGIPFCPSTCLYCSFTSNPVFKFKDKIDNYIEAVCKEIDYCSKAFAHKRISTIYIGGGTPTTLEPYQLEILLKKINEKYNVQELDEFTVEAGRPDSITREKLQVIKKYGVTRISINPQTMKDETLKIIGRNHTVQQVISAYNMAREEGFDNINMDFILGLPEETEDDVRYSMDMVTELKPDSLTIHSLAVKRAAKLNIFKDDYKAYNFNNSDEVMEITRQTANALGLKPYYLYRQKNMKGNLENVGYAREGKEGIYNILIMEEKQTILAVGAGASTKMVFPNEERIERIENVKDVDLYIKKIDEMIDRKRKFIEENECFKREEMPEAITHGICVSNIAYRIGKELGCDDDFCNMLAVSGMVHDIGKLKVYDYLGIAGDDTLTVEKMKHIRMHSQLGYDILKQEGFSDDILEAVLYHHENYDGSGYPGNLSGDDIPLSARILRVCDVFAALISDRSYRKAFDIDTAIELMIDEVKNFDMNIFLTFMKIIHSVDINKITGKDV